tara:strand:+ start:332 stop:1456 length:1125 start_codon:yes stop_codon:yes gene_type:complete
MKKNFYLLILVSTVFTNSCKEEPAEEATPPSNLIVDVTINDENLGLISLNAQADRANFYSWTFDDGSETIYEEETDGLFTYEFRTSGTYSIMVRAHAAADSYIQDEELVEIVLPIPGNEGEAPVSGYTTPTSYSGYELVWQDEFSGKELNADDWNLEIGAGNNGWGNNELQYYRSENVSVSNGMLTIEAKAEFFNSNNYTSSRITTQDKESFKYGRIDIRAALPYGQGLWPALWMLGNDISSVGWPNCGEIDIMELAGGSASGKGDDVILGTIHWDNNGSYANYGDKTQLSSGTFADQFHVFSIIWNEQSVTWYLDDTKFNEVDIAANGLEEFHQSFFLIFNVAVGGDFSGSPDATTYFPQKMFVDYVRVFQEQ